MIKKGFKERWFSPANSLNNGTIRSVAFSPDGKILAAGSSDYSIVLWDIATGEKITQFTGHSASVNSVAFSPDGNTLASGASDNSIIIWDLDLYFLFHTKQGKPTPLFFAFTDGVEFFWGHTVDGLEIKSKRITSEKPQEDGYYFVIDPKYRPLLKPPKHGQDKIEQILEWAKKQIKN